MSLNRTDPKKAKYTVTVVADDKTIEKKDKTSGEPVQFYVKGSARMAPYEIVVFDVGKNQITRYLATPKDGGGSAPPQAATRRLPLLRRNRNFNRNLVLLREAPFRVLETQSGTGLLSVGPPR